MKRSTTQSGQVMVESLLTMILFLGIALFVVKQVKQNQWFAQLLSSPWTTVSCMIENGVWSNNPQTGRGAHPTQHNRVVSFKGKVDP